MITLHIKCKNESEKVGELEKLGIETVEEFDYRPFRLMPEMIIGYYPDTIGGTFIMIGDTELCVSESMDEVDHILRNF